MTYLLFQIGQDQLLPKEEEDVIEWERKEVQPANNDVVIEMVKPEQYPGENVPCLLCESTFENKALLETHAYSLHKELLRKVQATFNLPEVSIENDTAHLGHTDAADAGPTDSTSN